MRFWGRIATLLCVSVALLSTGVAYADIGPIAKPSNASVAPLPKPHATSGVQPTPAPQVAPASKPAQKPVTPATTATPKTTVSSNTVRPTTAVTTVVHQPTVTAPRVQTPPVKPPPVHIKVASINGGRELAAVRVLEDKVVRSKVVQQLQLTRLAVVGLHEALPSSEAWPDWLLAAIAIMASAEAFLLTRLAGARHFVEPSER